MSTTPKKEYYGLIFGIFMIAAGLFLYFMFNSYETSGGRVTIPRILLFLYELGGKWLVSGIFIFIGLIFSLVFRKGDARIN